MDIKDARCMTNFKVVILQFIMPKKKENEEYRFLTLQLLTIVSNQVVRILKLIRYNLLP